MSSQGSYNTSYAKQNYNQPDHHQQRDPTTAAMSGMTLNNDDEPEAYGSDPDPDSDSDIYEWEEEIDFTSWRPFKDFSFADCSPSTQTMIDQDCAAIVSPETSPTQKTQLALRILHPLLSKYETRFPDGMGWVRAELMRVFTGAVELGPERGGKMYFFNADVTVREDEYDYCRHDIADCSCWFEATAEAGIEEFPVESRHRRDGIAFTASLIVELMLRLATFGSEYDLFNAGEGVEDAKTVLKRVPELTLEAEFGAGENKGSAEDSDDDDNDDDDDDDDEGEDEGEDVNERLEFLSLDSALVTLATGTLKKWTLHHDAINRARMNSEMGYGEYEEEDDDDDDAEEGVSYYVPPTDEQQHFLTLCAILGRRALTLAVARWGKGHLFAERVPIHFWRFNDLVEDYMDETDLRLKELPEYLERSGKNEIEQPRYPVRVINTHTLEFEWDQMLYRKKYAILSHMWGKGEVTYTQAERLWAAQREQNVNQELTKVSINLNDPHGQARHDRAVRQDLERRRNALQQEKATMVKARSAKDGKVQAQAQVQVQVQEESHLKAPTLKPADRNTMGKKGNTIGALEPGEAKLMNAIRMARRMGYTYLWIDTCCINKADNSELIESISSMGDWYQNADVCLIYLHDVEDHDPSQPPTPLRKLTGGTRWAERGWTLQEVVLCPRAVFFNRGWRKIFDSASEKRSRRVAQICRAPLELLWHGRKPEIAASAVLAIAADRKTTRAEDRAYSLMGILGVRLPADYGEGQDKAISRLLEIIIRTTGDVSVFNWSGLYAASRRPGRSMYPFDFAGYRLTHSSPHAALPPKLTAHSEITLGHSGVHARFDVWQSPFTVLGGNAVALAALDHMDATLAQSDPDLTSRHATALCNVVGYFVLAETELEITPLSIEAAVSRATLRRQLECAANREAGRPVSSNWALARFSGCEGSNWFLAELTYDTQIADNGLFAHVFRGGEDPEATKIAGEALGIGTRGGGGGGGGMEGVGTFMHYLENRGFQAKRLAARFDQSQVPVEEGSGQNVNLWVG